MDVECRRKMPVYCLLENIVPTFHLIGVSKQNMRPHIFLLVITIFLTFSCSEESQPNTSCSVENPIEDLDWLAAAIQTLSESGMSQYLYVTQARYGFVTVFIFGNCCPNCNSIIPVYSCSGDHIGNIGNGEGDIDFSILNNDVVIWKPDNSACNF